MSALGLSGSFAGGLGALPPFYSHIHLPQSPWDAGSVRDSLCCSDGKVKARGLHDCRAPGGAQRSVTAGFVLSFQYPAARATLSALPFASKLWASFRAIFPSPWFPSLLLVMFKENKLADVEKFKEEK